ILPFSASGGKKPSLELLVEIALYFHVSTDYLLLGRELDRDSIRVSLLELSAQMTDLNRYNLVFRAAYRNEAIS
ncbi:MAG: hypothetical protein ACI4EC_02820, partial [Lachnospiraceae bacterium]